jgi:hypothetical protein
MDAPQHSQARAADLGQFRRWNRTRSYTFGDTQGPTQVPQGIKPSGSADNNQFGRANVPLGMNPRLRPIANTIGHSRERQSFHSLHTLEEDHNVLEDADRQAVGVAQSDEYDEEAAASDGASTETEEVEDADPELQDASFGDDYSEDVEESATSPSNIAEEEPPQTQPEEEEEEDEDEYGNFDSSPCVTAEMKRGKNRGKQFFQRTFKPLAFKPFGLSLAPPNPSRGMTRASSHII